MSIVNRPIWAFSLILLFALAGIWGEWELLRVGPAHGAGVSGLALFFFGWVGVVLLIAGFHRKMSADAGRLGAAEESARQAGRLMQITAVLGGTRTSASAIEAILQEPAHALRADAAMLVLLSPERHAGTIARAIGYPEGLETITIQDGSLFADAIKRGVVLTTNSRKSRVAEYPEPALDTVKGEALVVVPLSIERRVAALLVLEFNSVRAFSEGDRELLETVAARGSQALERTRQHESVDRARLDAESLRARADLELAERQKTEQALRSSETQYRALAARTARLHELTAALSEASTIDAVARAVIEHGKVAVGASDGEVLLLDSNRTQLRPLLAGGAPPEPVTEESGLSLTDAVQNRRPVFIASMAEWQEKSWRSAPMAADKGHASSATLPLLVDSEPIGVLVFQFSAPVNFEDSYKTLLISVAQHCGQALDRARLYETAEKARAVAEDANRHKDEFLSMVSHELRTPLNAMLGWSAMLQEGVLDSAVTDRALHAIHTNAKRQSKLIEELLDVSRILSGRLALESEPIDPGKLLSGVVESLLPLAVSTGVELRMDPVSSMLVDGDLRRLEQVFLNLLTNALKFTPAGGKIELSSRLDGNQVEVSVTDTGIGIDAGFLPSVFDRFRQADSTSTRSAGGLGLGLSIAKHIVEAHKGTIAAHSAGTGQGSTFTVRLPAASMLAAIQSDAPVQTTAQNSTFLNGVRVLVVDDESDAREVIAKALEARGAEVTTAKSASDGFDIVTQQPVDVLLADVAMPVEDGHSLMRRIRGHKNGRIASIPAIAVTAGARVEERRQALDAGFQLHLAKPVEPAQLASSVRQLIPR